MKRARTKLLTLAPVLLVVLVSALGLTGCYDGYEAGYEVDPAQYPSAAYVATEEPVYFEGRPAYWYGDRWYYRDGGRWGYYRTEPRYLNQYRARYGYGRGYGRGYRGGYRGGYRSRR